MNLKTKKEELQELIFSAGEQIQKYMNTEEEIKELLNFKKQFHVYSLRNQALINSQFRGAYAVGSFEFWKNKGFSVKRGEKGLKILVPMTVTFFSNEKGESKRISDATDEEKIKIKAGVFETKAIKTFGKGNVWDISQTTATEQDLPKLFPNRWTDATVENYPVFYQGLEKVAQRFDIKIIDAPYELGMVKGISIPSQRSVALNPRNGELQNVKTLIHELAHAKLHTTQTRLNYTKEEREFQAELVAYAICSNYGMDVSEYSLAYMKSWVKDSDIPKRTKLLAEVYDTCIEYIKVIDQHLVEHSQQDLSLQQQQELQTQKVEQHQSKELTEQDLSYQDVSKGADATLQAIISKKERQAVQDDIKHQNVQDDVKRLANERQLSVNTLLSVGAEVTKDWLQFPVLDEVGQEVGKASRRLQDNEKLPKWKLSPNFPKKDVLYLFNESKYAIEKSKQAIIVEGIFDALAFKEVGFNNVVGLLGASMSQEQLARLNKSGATQFIIATDHDVAGFNAGLTIEKQLKESNSDAQIYFLNLGNQKDPCELLMSLGVDGFKEWLSLKNPFTKTKLSNIVTQKELAEIHHVKNPASDYAKAQSQFLSSQQPYHKDSQYQSKQDRSSIISLKRDLNIIDVCEELLGLKLERAGRGEYQATCPTLHHNERTPSFFVSEKKQCFKCFGCGAGGDVIQLAKQSLANEQGEALSFKETLEVLHKYRQSLGLETIKRNQQHFDELQQSRQQKEQTQTMKL